MSILLYCYEQLIDCTSQVEQMMVAVEVFKEEEEEASSAHAAAYNDRGCDAIADDVSFVVK
jgi:hypothetical protein